MRLTDWLIVIALGTVWGGSFLFNAIMVQEINPITISFGRVFFAALLCWAVFFALGKRIKLDGKTLLGLITLGIVNFAIPFALFPLAQKSVSVGVSGITNALTPIMVVIVSQFWPGGEKATFSKSLGVLAGFSGVTILAIPALQQGGHSELWAIGLIILATLCYGISMNIVRSYHHIDSTLTTCIALTGASLALLPFMLTIEGIPHITKAQTWWSIGYISIIATAIPFLIVYKLVERVGATNFSTATFVAPVSALILGFLVLGEPILPVHLFGMLAIFIGILMIDGRLFLLLKRPKPTL
ncbi:drug/metabolite transporter (DMT)-like permease [Maritalea mobilis]|uniref:Drug/metabolite transporter (DMT)-like permease n=1 Tax=Maritalea mobilis TaxID=483324 RepID=A0A4R6VR36_9HYPH|nr:DMT family transporter [Maritalea mobilis]TDQ66462.1 drug/metabolite transporter (DMT)-like permease [Maritalea mobilis]